jgi:hypothetical protein
MRVSPLRELPLTLATGGRMAVAIDAFLLAKLQAPLKTSSILFVPFA